MRLAFSIALTALLLCLLAVSSSIIHAQETNSFFLGDTPAPAPTPDPCLQFDTCLTCTLATGHDCNWCKMGDLIDGCVSSNTASCPIVLASNSFGCPVCKNASALPPATSVTGIYAGNFIVLGVGFAALLVAALTHWGKTFENVVFLRRVKLYAHLLVDGYAVVVACAAMHIIHQANNGADLSMCSAENNNNNNNKQNGTIIISTTTTTAAAPISISTITSSSSSSCPFPSNRFSYVQQILAMIASVVVLCGVVFLRKDKNRMRKAANGWCFSCAGFCANLQELIYSFYPAVISATFSLYNIVDIDKQCFYVYDAGYLEVQWSNICQWFVMIPGVWFGGLAVLSVLFGPTKEDRQREEEAARNNDNSCLLCMLPFYGVGCACGLVFYGIPLLMALCWLLMGMMFNFIFMAMRFESGTQKQTATSVLLMLIPALSSVLIHLLHWAIMLRYWHVDEDHPFGESDDDSERKNNTSFMSHQSLQQQQLGYGSV